MARCQSCQKPVEWAVVESTGRRIPLDPPRAVGRGNLRAVGWEDDERGGHPVVAYVEPGSGDRIAHFATCPYADRHRRR